MADRLILTGTTSLELSAKGSGSDVRSWAAGKLGTTGARLFLNNIAEPGNVDTIINLHRGNVGIGTSSPSTKLTVETAQLGPLVLVRNVSGGDGIRSESTGNGHGLSGASVSHTGTEGASETGIGVHGLSNRGPGVKGETQSGPAVRAETIQGNLFEGSQIGNLRFVVLPNGAVLADGGFSGPADFAEMLPAAGSPHDFEPGDVLVIGPEGKLTRCATPNAVTLAGVYSTKPGFVGDQRMAEQGLLNRAENRSDGETWLPVALLGVVPVNATAEEHAIRPGDMLTTSATPGHAMRAIPVHLGGADLYPTGTIIGKSLEPLASGRGKIQMLVLMR
jgi:hypothetical protein